MRAAWLRSEAARVASGATRCAGAQASHALAARGFPSAASLSLSAHAHEHVRLLQTIFSSHNLKIRENMAARRGSDSYPNPPRGHTV